MGKKRVTYDCNDLDVKPPNHVITDHHHHHNHHHRHHNQPKAKKIKPDAKLLHTLSSHLKKLGKRSRNTFSISTPPPPPPPPTTTISNANIKRRHGHQCHKSRRHDWFMGLDSDHQEDHHHDNDGDDMTGVFNFGKELCWKTLLFENNDDLFGGDYVFAPDLINASRRMMLVIEDGFGCGSYIPDPVVHWDNGNEGTCLYDILELSSQEDMINEFFKVNLFVS